MPSDSRVKLLFVVTQLVQGGSERYLFELVRALDPARFQVGILFRRRPRPSDHYYWKLKDMGFTFHRRLPLRRNFARFLPRIAETAAWRRLEDAVYSARYAIQLRGLFDRYDVINILQIEHFNHLKSQLRDHHRHVAYLMSSGFQYSTDPYAQCSQDLFHRFVIMDPDQENDLKRATVPLKYETFLMPLSMAFGDYPELPAAPAADADGVVHMAVFIRISSERTIEPIFECFAAFARLRAARLHVYGSGDPGVYADYLEERGIADRVIFEGHCPDIPHALQADGINIICMTCHDTVLGYASIEIAATARPMLFWNLGSAGTDEVAALTDGAMLAYRDANAFAEACDSMIRQPAVLTEHGRRLSRHVRETRDITKNIGALESYLLSVARADPRHE